MIAALLPLAGCGSPTPQPAPSPVVTAASGDAATIAALSPKLRAGVLLRAIRDAGQDCQQVVGQTALPPGGGPLTWLATCQDGRHWTVAVAPDGMATVTDANAPAPRH